MTDKERIEVYVNRMPKNCEDCPCLEMNLSNCNLTKKCVIHECACIIRPQDCPLKTIQSIQNQKAVSALQKVKYIMLKNIEKNYGFGDKMHHVVDCKKLAIEINNLIKELGGKDE